MLQLKESGFKKAMDTAKLLSLPPNMRRRYLARMGRMGIAQTKANVKNQRTVDGSAMKPRKKVQLKMSKAEAEGKEVRLSVAERRLMFKKMVGSKFLRVKLGEDTATIAFGRAGAVASKHHYGFKDTYEAYNYPGTFDTSKVQTRLNKEVGPDGCTANMAATLIRTAVFAAAFKKFTWRHRCQASLCNAEYDKKAGNVSDKKRQRKNFKEHFAL